jgi:DNA mismatch repair protein MutL
LLPELARSLDEGGASGGTERWIQERIATAACRAAVKARDRLSLQEIERLVVDLAVAKMPYTCPHGRPTLIHFSYGDLHRRFGRSS